MGSEFGVGHSSGGFGEDHFGVLAGVHPGAPAKSAIQLSLCYTQLRWWLWLFWCQCFRFCCCSPPKRERLWDVPREESVG